MSVSNTGVLNFTWPEVQDAEYYKLKFYKNESYSRAANTSETGFQITGLREGDSVYVDVYNFINGQTSIEKFTSPVQSVDVFNFHNFNQSLAFSGISLDGVPLDLTFNANAITASGVSLNENSSINLFIQNPRDNNTISYFNEEPFLTGVKYRSVYSLSDNTNYTEASDFNFITTNPGKLSRSYTTEVIVQDYYGSGITGYIFASGQLPQVSSLKTFRTTTETGLSIDFIGEYSSRLQYIDYFFYDNPHHTGNSFVSGSVSDSNRFSVSIPLDTTGYLQLLPHDWFGSGELYSEPDYFYSNISSTTEESYNSFDNVSVDYGSSFGFANIFAQYSDISNSGSLIYFSIDSGNNSKFNSDSLFTGQLNNASGYEWNYFNYLDPDQFVDSSFNNTKQPFFVNFKLIQDQSNVLEAEDQIQFNAATPSIRNSNIIFNYQQGLTSLQFSTFPNYTYTGIDILISGKNDSNYHTYTGSLLSVNDIEYYADIQLVHSQDDSIVFDASFASGSGSMPSLEFERTDFNEVESIANFYLSNPTSIPINGISAYGRYSFHNIEGSGYIGDTLSGLLNFEDYLNYESQNAIIGLNSLPAPTGITRNDIYTSTGIGFTGFYESGAHFQYRFLPNNGYGTGHATPSIPYEFFFNAITEKHQDSLDALSDQVENLENLAVSLYSDNVTIASGDCSVTVDYSVAGFTGVPHVVGTLSTVNQDDPILGFVLSGEPTSTSASFILSDQVTSTGYKLKYLASENII